MAVTATARKLEELAAKVDKLAQEAKPAKAPQALPKVTKADAGKVLMVGKDGKWTLATLPD